MRSLGDALVGLVCYTGSVLLPPTVLMLLCRRFVPGLGEEAWRWYCRLLTWMVVAPVRLVRLLVREIRR